MWRLREFAIYVSLKYLLYVTNRQQEGHPACKKLSGGCWCGYLSGARCRLAYGPADATATHSDSLSCFSKIQIGFTFLVPAHLGSPGQRAVKHVCVCVCDNDQKCLTEKSHQYFGKEVEDRIESDIQS